MSNVLKELRESINSGEMPTYIYGYPSKRTYSTIEENFDLVDFWSKTEGKTNLYIHIPFCNYKCSYCTLLMTSEQNDMLIDNYISALIKQIEMYSNLASHLEVTSIYFGGGTPTILSEEQLQLIFKAIYEKFPKIGSDIEISVEGSPETMTVEKLESLKKLGVNRVSMGIQTLDPDELEKTGRRHSYLTSIRAMNNIKKVGFENFNIDLIYGLENQTRDKWEDTLRTILSFEPETISLYPIVFRPLSGIDKRKEIGEFIENQEKYDIYDFNVDLLESEGYRQESLTRFTKFNKDSYAQEIYDFEGIPLIGLGAGARSYIKNFHYSTDYAVMNNNKMKIIQDFIDTSWNQLEGKLHGIFLEEEEEMRRYIILNLLVNKLNNTKLKEKFDTSLMQDFNEEIEALKAECCVTIDEKENILLSRKGFKYSSIIGRLFYSDTMTNLEESYVAK